MNRIKKILSIFLVCAFCTLVLSGCGNGAGGSLGSSSQSNTTAVLSLLNRARTSNGVNSLSENNQADIVAARIANCGIDYVKGNLTEQQFQAEYYDACLTTIQGNYFSAVYQDTCVPTRVSQLVNEQVAYKSGTIVGIAIREYRNLVVTVIIVY